MTTAVTGQTDLPHLRTLVSLAEAQDSIRDGDLLLWRRRGLISIAGRGPYSHAAKAAWWYGRGWLGRALFCLEIREWIGGRAVPLESCVNRAPGRIDVFATNPDNRWLSYRRWDAVGYMRTLCGKDYGWWNLWRCAALHLPVVRWLVRAETDDEAENGNHPPFCSQAVAMADRIGGGVDPVPQLADRLTEPGDLARSPFYEYRFTLVP